MAIDITATKPAKQPGNPSFATNGGTRVEPTLGQKQTGWTNAQRPPFNLFNWILGFLADWAKYNEDAADELDTGKLSRKGTGASTPQGMIGTLSSERNKVDDNGASATRWATIWGVVLDLSDALAQITINALIVLTDKALTLAADPGTKNTAHTRTLTSRSMPKIWALIVTDGLGHAAGNVSLVDGFNISGVAFHSYGGGFDLTLTFASNFVSNAAIFITIDTVSGTSAVLVGYPQNRSASTVDLHFYNAATGADVDLTAIGMRINVLGFGVQ